MLTKINKQKETQDLKGFVTKNKTASVSRKLLMRPVEDQIELLSVSIENYFRYFQFMVQHGRHLEVVSSIITTRKRSEQCENQKLSLDVSEN